MERFYSTLKNLPTELLSLQTAASSSLDEIKNYRWLTRDTFLQISQSPFAAANGIGTDHLYNFLDLQDALIVKLLIKKLEVEEEEEINEKRIRICAMIQLVLSESPKLIEFLFAYPQDSDQPESFPLKPETLTLLIQNCPALFNCTHLFKDFIHMDSYRANKFYYWYFVILLMEKYPIQATFELAKEVVAEIDKNYASLGALELKNVQNIARSIKNVFPMIDLTAIRHRK